MLPGTILQPQTMLKIVQSIPQIQIETGWLAKASRSLSYFLLTAVALVIWNGNITAIEIKDFVVQMGCLIIAVLAGCRIITREKVFLPLDPLLLLVVAFVVLVAARYVFTSQSSINFRAAVPQLYGPLFFLLMVFTFSKTDLTKIARLLAVVAAAASMHGIFQYFNIDFVEWLDKGYVFATFGQKNVFALFLVLQIPLTLYLAVGSNRKNSSICWLFLAAVMFACLLLTGSRGALASFIVLALAISSLAFFGKGESKGKEIRYCLFFSLMLLAVLLGGYKKILPQIQGLLTTKSASVSQRLAYYKSAVEIIKESPLAGIGPGNFLITYPRHAEDAATKRDPNNATKHVHSDFLEIWAEYGIFTLFAYLAIIALFVKRLAGMFLAGSKNGNRIQSLLLLLSLGSYFLYTQVSEGGRYMSSIFYFWTLLGICHLFLSGASRPRLHLQMKNLFLGSGKVAILSCCVLIIFTGFMANRVYANYASDVYLKTSLDYANGRDYKKSLNLLTKSIESNDKSLEAYYQKGFLLFSFENNYDLAIDNFKKVYELSPGYTNTVFNIASCYYRKLDFFEAINWLNITHEIYPEYIPGIILLSECYYYTGDPENSFRYVNEALRLLEERRELTTFYSNALALKNKLISINTK